MNFRDILLAASQGGGAIPFALDFTAGALVSYRPDPQPYTYFITYAYTAGPHSHGTGSVWHTRPTLIEDAASELVSREKILRDHPTFDTVVITNFILTDGPY